ncbi:copper chaperone CopZ [Halalkalibacter hemicellulosilyticus]|uniref:Copper chaperone CopZ n=1 Tax=Halalkalibacter hemicellulosilyticusJCM 9152 TaxID=1236971 RepID=W4QKX2_9BACI|nr:copper chaperone CopZ [Halalkalibacter hemicellulosilyticus]GAE31974.1 copper-ion-binding protein [Halalkalibacter hemicellulosilyticusJCM 9152]
MEQKTLSVKGMSCGHCVSSIKENVGELGGVSKVNVDLQRAKVAVQYDADQVTVDSIKEVIEEQGYDVEGIESANS